MPYRATLPVRSKRGAVQLLAFFDGLAILALACYAIRFSASGARPWPWLALFVLTALGAFLTHYTSLIFIASCFVAIGLHLLTTRPLPVREALVWAATGLVIILAVINPLPLAKSLSASANISWIEPLSPFCGEGIRYGSDDTPRYISLWCC